MEVRFGVDLVTPLNVASVVCLIATLVGLRCFPPSKMRDQPGTILDWVVSGIGVMMLLVGMFELMMTLPRRGAEFEGLRDETLPLIAGGLFLGLVLNIDRARRRGWTLLK